MANIVQFPDRGARLLEMIERGAGGFSSGFMEQFLGEKERREKEARQQDEMAALFEVLSTLAQAKGPQPAFESFTGPELTGPGLAGTTGTVPALPGTLDLAALAGPFSKLGPTGAPVAAQAMAIPSLGGFGQETPLAKAAREAAEARSTATALAESQKELKRVEGEEARKLEEQKTAGQVKVTTLLINQDDKKQQAALAAEKEKDYNLDPLVVRDPDGSIQEISYADRLTPRAEPVMRRKTFELIKTQEEAAARSNLYAAQTNLAAADTAKMRDDLTRNGSWLIVPPGVDPMTLTNPVIKTGARDELLKGTPDGSFALPFADYLTMKQLAIADKDVSARLKALKSGDEKAAVLLAVLAKPPNTWTPQDRAIVSVLGNIASSPEGSFAFFNYLQSFEDPTKGEAYVKMVEELKVGVTAPDSSYLESIAGHLVNEIKTITDPAKKRQATIAFNVMMQTAAPDKPALWTWNGAVEFLAPPPANMSYDKIKEAGMADPANWLDRFFTPRRLLKK